MIKQCKKLIGLFILVVLCSTFLQNVMLAKVDDAMQSEFQTAKKNLIIGQTELANKQFSELATKVEPVKNATKENKNLYDDVMYNLGLIYEQKYNDDSIKNPLEGASTDDLLKANKYFETADPKIFETVAVIQGENADANTTRAVGGIVGKIIKGKVKEWLKTEQNCKCSFTQSELENAGTIFINLTEKQDIPALKSLKTRDTKIQEIFNRIKNYISDLVESNPVKILYTSKIKVSCKL